MRTEPPSGPGRARNVVRQAVAGIAPADDEERAQQRDVLRWIDSGAPLFRTRKPDVPPRHLVSYVVVLDAVVRTVLLVDHVKAQLWLPAGGHVELDEDPRATVAREADEELGLPARFHERLGDRPLFVSSTTTVGLTAGHTDVSLWYVLTADSTQPLHWDAGEFDGVRWFGLEELLGTDPATLDPCMHRFVRKLVAATR